MSPPTPSDWESVPWRTSRLFGEDSMRKVSVCGFGADGEHAVRVRHARVRLSWMTREAISWFPRREEAREGSYLRLPDWLLYPSSEKGSIVRRQKHKRASRLMERECAR